MRYKSVNPDYILFLHSQGAWETHGPISLHPHSSVHCHSSREKTYNHPFRPTTWLLLNQVNPSYLERKPATSPAHVLLTFSGLEHGQVMAKQLPSCCGPVQTGLPSSPAAWPLSSPTHARGTSYLRELSRHCLASQQCKGILDPSGNRNPKVTFCTRSTTAFKHRQLTLYYNLILEQLK